MTLTLGGFIATMGLGVRSTLISGRAAPVSLAAFSCSKSFMGQMGFSVRMPAWLITCYEHLSHPMSIVGQKVAFKNSIRSVKMPTSISNVAFHGADLPLVSINNKPHAAIKPICEAIGIDWHAQRQRIKRDPVLNLVEVITTSTGFDGKQYEMLCLPLGYLNGWLLGVNANRVKPEIRQKLIQYQMECYDALYQHFMPKVAHQYPHTINTEQQYQIKEAVINLHRATGEHYGRIYNRLHTQFKIPRYQDLPASRFDEALAYLNSSAPTAWETVEVDMMSLVALCSNMRWVDGWWHQYGKAVAILNSCVSSSVHDHFKDGSYVASSLINRHSLDVASIDCVRHYPFHAPHKERHQYYLQHEKR